MADDDYSGSCHDEDYVGILVEASKVEIRLDLVAVCSSLRREVEVALFAVAMSPRDCLHCCFLDSLVHAVSAPDDDCTEDFVVSSAEFVDISARRSFAELHAALARVLDRMMLCGRVHRSCDRLVLALVCLC